MSTALAIASVTAVLKDLLNNGLIDHDLTASVGDVTVSSLPPDRITTDANEKSSLNLFLYHVTPNAAWRNASLPSRNPDGERLTNPPLALDLHYLLTAYGERDLHAEILLGYGMQLLHETPVLTRDAIRRSLAPPSPVEDPASTLPADLRHLFTSELAEQLEQIKITPQTQSTEEISKLWSAFQTHYRPSASYQASVVLIESKRSTRAALPVRARNIYGVPFRQPVIEEIQSQKNPAAPVLRHEPILATHTLVLVGTNLRGDQTRVRVGEIEVTPAPTDIETARISFQLPADLRAGVQGVQVVHSMLMGTPPLPHRAVESNVAAFVLRPRIKIPTLNVTDTAADGGDFVAATINFDIVPEAGKSQRVRLILDEFNPPNSRLPRSYSFARPNPFTLDPLVEPPETTASLSIPVRGVAPGNYLVRVQVDGAESVLKRDAGEMYNAPQITINPPA